LVTLGLLVFCLLPIIGFRYFSSTKNEGSIRRVVSVVKCPIHCEDTPSCMVYDDGHLQCLSCGASGNAKEMHEKGVASYHRETLVGVE